MLKDQQGGRNIRVDGLTTGARTDTRSSRQSGPGFIFNVPQNSLPMKKSILSVILAVVISGPVFAAANTDYPPISIVAPTGGSSVDKKQFLMLVVDAGFISCDGTAI